MGNADVPTVEKEAENSGAVLESMQGSRATGLGGLEAALRKEKATPWSRAHLSLYVCCGVACLCSVMNGFNGSLLGAIQTLDSFKSQMGSDIVGEKIALITGVYSIGSIVALPFVAPATDMFGRRFGIFVSCCIISAGTIVCATSASIGQFIGGRLILGFGIAIASAAAPSYVVEISPPQYRGTITAIYNCHFYIGAIAAAGTVRGCMKYDSSPFHGNNAWVIPVWSQLICPGLISLVILFLPESPRWLFSHSKSEQCLSFLTKYHGEGREDHASVQLQLQEYQEQISKNGSDKRAWDYRELFNTPANRYRFYNMLIPSVFGQWSGNGVVTYYLPAMLQSAGITSNSAILNINLGNLVTSAFGGFLGASFVQKIGRRPMLIGVCIGCSIVFAFISIGTGLYNTKGWDAAGTAGIVFIFIFGIVFSFGWTPLLALYPVECLSYEQRAKGMAFSNVAGSAAVLLNQFAWPIALKRIGWYTYLIFVIWDLVEALVCWLMAVETNRHTLEELCVIYAAKHPVKASLERGDVIAGHQMEDLQA